MKKLCTDPSFSRKDSRKMKFSLVYIFALSTISFSGETNYIFNNMASMKGRLTSIKFETLSGEKYPAYILKLAKRIDVQADNNCEEALDVGEVQLNIDASDVKRFSKHIGKEISVSGMIYCAETQYDRRPIVMNEVRISK